MEIFSEVLLILLLFLISSFEKLIPLDIVSLSSNILSIIPYSNASCAGTCLPVNIISKPVSIPANRGNLCVPPAPGNIPSNTSGRPTFVFGVAIL